jgi:hypothetical protein
MDFMDKRLKSIADARMNNKNSEFVFIDEDLLTKLIEETRRCERFLKRIDDALNDIPSSWIEEVKKWFILPGEIDTKQMPIPAQELATKIMKYNLIFNENKPLRFYNKDLIKNL